MRYFAVIDTNVIVSSLITKNKETATVQVVKAVLDGRITPLYHQDILNEYYEVLHRPQFHLDDKTINAFINAIKQFGVEVFPQPSGEILIDMDDLIFYEVALEKRDSDAYLVIGNLKHYPIRDYIITPSEMMKIIEK